MASHEAARRSAIKASRPAVWPRMKSQSRTRAPCAMAEADMIGCLVSLLTGVAVRVAYALVRVRSPAPSLIALVGLLGMVLREYAVDVAKRYL